MPDDPGAIGGPRVAPQCAEVFLVWTMPNGRVARNVLGVRYSGSYPGTQALCNTLLTAFTTGATWTAMQALLSTGTSLSFVSMKDINGPNLPVVSSNSAGSPGTAVGNPMPANVSLVVTFTTSRTGPANRGRAYIPGWAASAGTTAGAATAGAQTALTNWIQTIRTALATNGLTPVIVQPARQAYVGATGTSHPPRAATSTDIAAHSVRNTTWDSQRKRQGRT